MNRTLSKEKPKVVDILSCSGECKDIEDLANDAPEKMSGGKGKGKLVMCRCWKSKCFPYCDGSHVQHNKETGDNVGPLVIKK